MRAFRRNVPRQRFAAGVAERVARMVPVKPIRSRPSTLRR
jgi:hypothetical protein